MNGEQWPELSLVFRDNGLCVGGHETGALPPVDLQSVSSSPA